MFLIVIYSVLLTFGFLSSQSKLIDCVLTPESIHAIASACLAYIMFNVGLEFCMPKKNNIEDQAAAFLGALVPWILCSIYMIFVMQSQISLNSVQNGLLLACFAAPTSAGILFSMLEAAGLEKTWVFQKAKMLAVLDDIYTLILIIPLRALNFGISTQLASNMLIVLALFYFGYKFPNYFRMSIGEVEKIVIAISLTFLTIFLAKYGIEIDVVTPAFVSGWIIKPKHEEENIIIKNVVSACFMFMVGASMPNIKDFLTNQEGEFFMIGIHVLAITQLSNIGKFCSSLFYSKEASIKERIALSVSMLPRGEVGAGILMIAATAGIKGITGAVAILSLALNLLTTGFLIKIVKTLLSS